ncbi:LOW QUALITY PROTEIN: flavonol 3-sulfotransferase-like [Henckelia pumila]|uniref:LOW QUALITY PROTEIN: flavonol 3-sulfotransferase-like n=1 Tax=Henckelia pumila TaxID=405737 RepID=UPI003C6E2564
MASSTPPNGSTSIPKKPENGTDEMQETVSKYDEILSTLPTKDDWIFKNLVKYQNTWYIPDVLKGILLAQAHFSALPSDIFLATFGKFGTTWIKALTFTIMNRNRFEFERHPLLTMNPQQCFPFLEVFLFRSQDNIFVDIKRRYRSVSSPRVISVHTPCMHLPESVTRSGCRVVYVTRDPNDIFVSSWYHMQKARAKGRRELTLEGSFDMFCEGVYQFGPYWEHVLGYHDAATKSPQNVLILRFEDIKENPFDSVRKLAKHLGYPFSLKEERNGILEKTVNLCSFDHLSNLEVNKSGVQKFSSFNSIENHVFFRKGGTGDWKTHLTKEMADRINHITKERFKGTGITHE